MFKGLSEIISKFSMTQRLAALGILLVSGLLWKLGSDMIQSFKPDASSCRTELKSRDKKIRILQMTIDTLDLKVIEVQRKCTNESARRESEFIEILDELRGDIAGYNRRESRKTVISQESYAVVNNQVYSDSSIVTSSAPMERQVNETVIVKSGGIENKKANELLKKIDRIKRKMEGE